HARSPVRGLRRLKRGPVRFRIPNVDVDRSLEWFRHAALLGYARPQTYLGSRGGALADRRSAAAGAHHPIGMSGVAWLQRDVAHGLAARTSRSTAPRMPFTNAGASVPQNSFAVCTASSIAPSAGIPRSPGTSSG